VLLLADDWPEERAWRPRLARLGRGARDPWNVLGNLSSLLLDLGSGGLGSGGGGLGGGGLGCRDRGCHDGSRHWLLGLAHLLRRGVRLFASADPMEKRRGRGGKRGVKRVRKHCTAKSKKMREGVRNFAKNLLANPHRPMKRKR